MIPLPFFPSSSTPTYFLPSFHPFLCPSLPSSSTLPNFLPLSLSPFIHPIPPSPPFNFSYILFVLMFICFFALFLQDRQCFLHASWGLLVSRIGCYCKSLHATFVCAFTRKVTSFNSVFIQQIRSILMITCVWIFFFFWIPNSLDTSIYFFNQLHTYLRSEARTQKL